MAPLLDGAIELLDLLPQMLCLVLQSRPLLLQLADVLGCLLQDGGLADLGGRGVRGEVGADHPCTVALCACCVLQPPTPQARAQERSFVLWVTAGMQRLWVTSHVSACPGLALGAHLDAGLSTQCAHQAVQRGEAELDVEASLLLSRDVCDAAAL